MDARICAPVRFRGELLGYLWLVDSSESLADQDLEIAAAAAEAAAEVLHVEKRFDELRRSRERELLRDLLSDSADLRQQAADELVESNLITPTSAAVVIVVRLRPDAGPIKTADRLAGGSLPAMRIHRRSRQGARA